MSESALIVVDISFSFVSVSNMIILKIHAYFTIHDLKYSNSGEHLAFNLVSTYWWL